MDSKESPAKGGIEYVDFHHISGSGNSKGEIGLAFVFDFNL